MTRPSAGKHTWALSRELGVGDLTWAESPRWRAGEVWISDTQGSRLVVVGGKKSRLYDLESPVNGTWFLPYGELVAARMHEARLERFDGQTWAVHADLSDVVLTRLGDLVGLEDGAVYVDDVGLHDGSESGRLLKIDPQGRASVAAEGLVFPNGLAVVDDGRTLVVAETYAGRLTKFAIGTDGRLEKRRLWVDLNAQLGPAYRPDGIWACRDGSVWVAASDGQAAVRIQDGNVVEQLEVDGFAIACCMSDHESELYVTVAKSVDPNVSVLAAVAEQRTAARVLRFCRA